MGKYYLWSLMAALLVTSACSPKNAPQITTIASGSPEQARMIFDSGGYYRLSASRMRDYGMQIDSANSIRLKYKDQQVPFWLLPGEDSTDFDIMFFVPENNDRYINQQVLLLETSADGVFTQPSAELQLEESDLVSTSAIAHSHLYFEEDQEYEPKAGIADPFVWAKIETSTPFQFFLPADMDAYPELSLLLTFWSPSSSPANPDHAILLKNNHVNLGLFEWEGSGYHQVEINLEEIQAQNDLEISAQVPAGVTAQLIFLDSIEVIFDRKVELASEQYRFELVGKLDPDPAQNSGFLVEKLASTASMRAGFVSQGQSLHISACEQCSYTWVPKTSLLSDFVLQPIEMTMDLNNSDHAVNWLVVAGKDRQQALEPLVVHRQAQGLRTLVIDPQQIYDQFYGGFPHPQALINFFAYIHSSWQISPEYVLLVGDFDYTHKGYSEMVSQIPSVFITSQYLGETVSDLPFMDVDNDLQPDFALGRVPFASPIEIRNWVTKLIRSEDGWKEFAERRVVAISDGQESYFTDEAANFLDQFGEAYSTSLFQAEKDSRDNGKSIQQALRQPVFLLTYFGHGSINSWGKDQILNAEIIEDLPSQQQLPIYVNMTCLSGYFIHPQQISLAESLLVQKESGAVTVIAPTSLTTAANQLSLSMNLVEQLQVADNMRIGDVLLKSWRMMDSNNTAMYEIMFSFILLGDPAYLLNT